MQKTAWMKRQQIFWLISSHKIHVDVYYKNCFFLNSAAHLQKEMGFNKILFHKIRRFT